MSQQRLVSWVVICPVCDGKIIWSGQPEKNGIGATCPSCKKAEVTKITIQRNETPLAHIKISYKILSTEVEAVF